MNKDELENELVTVQIFKIDYEILKHIAFEDDITIAHALSMQFSGFGFYNKGKIGWKIKTGKQD